MTDPEVIKKTWWPGQLWWIDADRTLLAPTLTQILPIVVNTSMVKEGDIKSFRDLLDPKWQGKMVLNDPTIVGTGPAWLAFVEATFGWDYAVDFAKNKPVVLRDQRLMIDWVAHGKASLLVGPKPDVLIEYIRAGAPIKGLIPAEGTWVLSSGTDFSMANRAAHPNAAKIFINWFLSKEGQSAVGPAAGYQSSRLDVPTDYLPPEQVRQPGVKYYIEEDEKIQLSHPDRMKRAQPLFGPLQQ